MPQGLFTVGIIAQYLEGSLNGKILAGIQKVLKENGTRIIVIRTTYVNSANYSLYDNPLSSDLVDGWIVMNKSVSPSFFERNYKLGKPIVSVNHEITSSPCTSVICDNENGMYVSTGHLIQHGHRRIAFMGDLRNPNMQLRLQGYKRALAYSGISVDEQLIIDTKSSNYIGGYNATDKLMKQPDKFTAIVAANDKNAIGAIERLREFGIRIPDDVAIIGFNNIRFAKLMKPSLSTVVLPTVRMGELAAEHILDRLKGESQRSETITVHCSFIPRESCGCSAAEERTEENQSRLETDSTAAEERSSVNLDYLHSLSEIYHEIGAELMRKHTIDIRELAWMSKMNWGSYAIWKNDHQGNFMLSIDQHFDASGDNSLVGQEFRCEQFPPINNCEDSQVIMLNLIRTNQRELGIMAFGSSTYIGDIGNRINVNMMSHLVDSFAAIMDREELFKEMQMQKNRFQTIAEQLRTITNATSDGIWIWNLKTDKLQWYNDRIYETLGLKDSQTLSSSEDFFRLIHPDDLERVQNMLREQTRRYVPYDMEFRMRRADDVYLWVNTVCEVLETDNPDDLKLVGSIRDITETKIAEDRITYLAYHDALTGLPNRMFFNQQLNESLQIARQQDHKLALLLLDLDRFKIINDTHGHQAGDELLLFVSNRMKALVNKDMTISRIGGDEFLLLMPHVTDREQSVTFGQQLLSVIRTAYKSEHIDFHVTGSLGISIFPDDGEDMNTLIKNADIAMYRAKMKGRNQLETFSEEMNLYTAGLLSLESALRKAIEREEFVVYYQPQIDLKTNVLSGFEALVRWDSPERGLVPPADFIPLAEDTGLIIEIDKWVLLVACQQMKQWQQLGCPPVKLSVNISGKQFERNDFLEQVESILRETQLDPSLLCFEITESMAIQDLKYCITVLEQLYRLGISISMDDFGTGYSSLALLRDLPIQYVKIDKSFIHDILTDRSDSAIVNAIISLSHSLDIQVIAEGVEVDGQRQLLQEQGCDYYQGYYSSKPIPANEFEKLFLL